MSTMPRRPARSCAPTPPPTGSRRARPAGSPPSTTGRSRGEDVRLTARYFVVACHGLETPKLLLMSEVANSSDQVGRNLMDHSGIGLQFLADEPLWQGRGQIQQGGIFNWRDGPFRARHAAIKHAPSNYVPNTAVAQRLIAAGVMGSELDRRIRDEASRWVDISTVFEMLPSPTNRVQPNPDRQDALGIPMLKVHYDDRRLRQGGAAGGDERLPQLRPRHGRRGDGRRYRLAEPRPPHGQRHHGRRPGQLGGRRRLPHLRPPQPLPRHHRRRPRLRRDQPDADRRGARRSASPTPSRGRSEVVRRLALALLALAGMAGAGSADGAEAPDPALVERGDYVARAGDCTACHTAPEPGSAPFAGGYRHPLADGADRLDQHHAVEDPRHRQLQPRGLRRRRPPGRHCPTARSSTRRCPTPPMPASPTTTSPRSTPTSCSPSHRSTPSPAETTALPFPFDFRPLMIGWNLLLRRQRIHAAGRRERSSSSRGQYLVETLGHCGTCHSPRNVLMGEDRVALPRRRHHRRLDRAQHHLGPGRRHRRLERGRDRRLPPRWLRPGQGASPRGAMAEAVEHSLRHLDRGRPPRHRRLPRDRAADRRPGPRPCRPMAGPRRARSPSPPTRPATARCRPTSPNSTTLDGAILFNGACATCHGVDGAGTPDGTYPVADRQRHRRRDRPGQPRPHHRRRRRPQGRERPRLHADLRRAN